jgi:hypothetical protein
VHDADLGVREGVGVAAGDAEEDGDLPHREVRGGG